jgi:uncharacterized Zn finger protein (UPF0148 family)
MEKEIICPTCGTTINTDIDMQCPNCGYCWILSDDDEEEDELDEDINNQNNSSSRGER